MKSVIAFYSIAEHIIDFIAAVLVYMWWISWRCLCRNFIICVLQCSITTRWTKHDCSFNGAVAKRIIERCVYCIRTLPSSCSCYETISPCGLMEKQLNQYLLILYVANFIMIAIASYYVAAFLLTVHLFTPPMKLRTLYLLYLFNE